MSAVDPELERWRLVLGDAGEACTEGAGLAGEAARRDAALDWLYGREHGGPGADRRGAGQEGSRMTTVTWLDEVHQLFPKETIERIEHDAVERYEVHDVVTDPSVLERVEPNPTLLRAVLRTKHLMDPRVLALARTLVEKVVRQLVEAMATEVRAAFSGARSRQPSRLRRASALDVHRTIRDNLRHHRPEEGRIDVERVHFRARTRRRLDPWQVVLLVDQSGSMVTSVIHSAVTAACLWGLPGVRTHLVAFDTSVVDLTAEVDDPVELLMKVQLGGGTDIARAVAYAADLLEQPRRSVVVLVSDLYEGGDVGRLVGLVDGLVAQGTHVLALAALDEAADPAFDRSTGAALASVGAHVGAMTPGELAGFLAEVLAS